MKRATPILLALGLLLIAAPAVSAAEAAVPEPSPELTPVAPEATLDLSTVECDASAELMAVLGGGGAPSGHICGPCSYLTSCDGLEWHSPCVVSPGTFGTCAPVGPLCSDGSQRCRCFAQEP